MKVVVYAICKNEAKFVDRWFNSMKEADEIYVLDTGSDDATVRLLRDRGVNVSELVISPWRFDVARNECLNLIPLDTDICVCTDLDEVFVPGWRNEVEKTWKQGINRLRYIYNWRLEGGKPVISFYGEKIHSRNNYKWIHPVHEVLLFDGNNECIETNDNVIVNHFPDSNKSREMYLQLLELSVKEDPSDDRNMHYLGREYMYYFRWNECIDTLIKHLSLPNATWKDERCASMRFIARSYINLKRYDEAKIWLYKAIDEAPYLREPYVELALLEYSLNNYLEVIKYCTKALMIKNNKMSYINERFCWDYTIDDLLSISYFYLGLYDISLFYSDRALKYDSSNERLLQNREFILKENNKV
jgi:tetratricopeptide (TPR) repeat protein